MDNDGVKDEGIALGAFDGVADGVLLGETVGAALGTAEGFNESGVREAPDTMYRPLHVFAPLHPSCKSNFKQPAPAGTV